MLTRASVHWADRIVAISSSNGLRWSSSQIHRPGYSSARRRIVSSAAAFRRPGSAHEVGTLPSHDVTSTTPDRPRPGSSAAHLVERTPRTWLTRVGADELPAAVAEVAAHGGGPLRWWVTEPTRADATAAGALGLSAERDLWQLRVQLPLPAPSALPVRAFAVGRDEHDWLAVNNRAFDWHPEQGGWTVEQLEARFAEPWFDPDGFLLHHDAASGRLAGFVWTKVHEPHGDDPTLGEIYVIGVDPAFAGRGLGRALTLAGFAWLHGERSVPVGMLYVDAGNEPAVRLYTSLGMTRHHTDSSFVGEVRPSQ